MNTFKTLAGGALVAALGVAATASAQTWPSKPVTMVVPFAAGGPTDAVGRALTPLMEKVWGQPFVVDNRPGAGGVVGTDYVARSAPDGYTVLFNGNGVHTAKIFTKTLPYEPNDVKPVVELAGSDYVIVTHPSVPAKNLKELVAYLKTQGKAVNHGTIPLTAYELDSYVFQNLTGTTFTVVPYNSAAPLITANLRNDVSFYFAIPGMAAQHVEAKTLNAIAITGPRRVERYPTVPTTHEQGVPFDAGFAFGLWLPAKTPDAAYRKLQSDVEKAVLSPEFGATMKKLSYDVPAKPSAYPERIQREVKTYFETAARVGVKPQ